MRIKASLAKQRFVLANLHGVELASLVSAVYRCRANPVKESSSLTHLHWGSAEFDALKITLLAYEVIFTSLFLSRSGNNI